MTKFFRLSTLALAGTMLAAGSAHAADMTVSATVQAACDFTVPAFTFAAKATNTNTDWDHTANLSITCTNGSGYTITIGKGINQETTSSRKMNNGTDMLPYKLYNNADYAGANEIPADDTAGNYGVAQTGTGAVQSPGIWARVAAADLTLAKAVTYTDTVAVTVTLNP